MQPHFITFPKVGLNKTVSAVSPRHGIRPKRNVSLLSPVSFLLINMSCPNKFTSKKADIEIKNTVKNQNFFVNRTVDKWTFLEFLIYKEQNALKRLKTMLLEYNNSISSLISKHKKQMDSDLLGYLTELKNKSFSNEDLKDLAQELAERNKESISIVNSTISNSNLIVGSGYGARQLKPSKKFICSFQNPKPFTFTTKNKKPIS